MPTLQDALGYAAQGWPVFPCHINAKTPACPNGYKDATTDEAKIREWWEQGDFNIGFCPENVGLCVIDEDTDKGGRYEEISSCTVRTPHGRHIYYAGSLPSGVNRIADGVDTRGMGGYVLVPPSTVGGAVYVYSGERTWPVPEYEIEEVPEWVVERCRTDARPRDRSVVTETDRPAAIKAFKRYLDNNPIPPEGEGSDDGTYRAVCRGRDLGLSDSRICEWIGRHSGFDLSWIEEKLVNVETYAQNEPGCDTPLTATEANRGLIEVVSGQRVEGQVVVEAEGSDWTPHDPRDPSTMPELSFFDDDKLIPKSPDGAIGILYGKRGDHKTNTVLSILAQSEVQRILYSAGEGAYAVERERIAVRPEMVGRLKILPRVPLLGNPDQIEAFINGCNAINWQPEIVVIDTLATALAGEDENSSITASHLTDNGTVGLIKRAWNCTVILVAHAGKDASKGVRGTSGFEGNVDFILLNEANKKCGAIKTTVTKMRDGYDGFSVYWKYDTDPSTVPVPAKIDEAEYTRLTTPQDRDETAPIGMIIQSYLRLNGHYDWLSGIELPALAEAMTIQEHGQRSDDVNDAAAWDTSKMKWRKALNNNKNKAWAKKCWDERVPPGGNEKGMTLRWFTPPDGDTDL